MEYDSSVNVHFQLATILLCSHCFVHCYGEIRRLALIQMLRAFGHSCRGLPSRRLFSSPDLVLGYCRCSSNSMHSGEETQTASTARTPVGNKATMPDVYSTVAEFRRARRYSLPCYALILTVMAIFGYVLVLPCAIWARLRGSGQHGIFNNTSELAVRTMHQEYLMFKEYSL